MNIIGFADLVKLENAIEDIRKYQRAYIAANNRHEGILVKWKPGWFAIYQNNDNIRVVRPTEFRNMTDRLEKRIKEKV